MFLLENTMDDIYQIVKGYRNTSTEQCIADFVKATNLWRRMFGYEPLTSEPYACGPLDYMNINMYIR